jgi:hypothetical protein
MTVIRAAKDLGAERTLTLATAIADDFDRAGWALLDYRWTAFSTAEDSAIELTFEALSPNAVPPRERLGSGLELGHPGRTAFLWTVALPLLAMGALVLLVLLNARH